MNQAIRPPIDSVRQMTDFASTFTDGHRPRWDEATVRFVSSAITGAEVVVGLGYIPANLVSPSFTTPSLGAAGAVSITIIPAANTTPFTISGVSLTGSNQQTSVNLSGTWNTSGTPTFIKLNVTDTSSNAESLLLDLQVGSTSYFKVRKDGMATVNGPVMATSFSAVSNVFAGGNLQTPGFLQITNAAGEIRFFSGSVYDTSIERASANNIAIGDASTGVFCTIGANGIVGDGDLSIYGGALANNDLFLEGTAHATKTSSFVVLQPTGGVVTIRQTSIESGFVFGVTGSTVLTNTNEPLRLAYDADTFASFSLDASGNFIFQATNTMGMNMGERLANNTVFSGVGGDAAAIGDFGSSVYGVRIRAAGAYAWATDHDIRNSPDTFLKRPALEVLSIEGASGVGGTLRAIPTSPVQITGNQNNYNPGGRSYFQRWSTDASRNVTGLTFTVAQVDGQLHVVHNVGAQDIVLKHQDAGSTDINRFICSTGADITLTPNQSAVFEYDATTQRWRVSKRN